MNVYTILEYCAHDRINKAKTKDVIFLTLPLFATNIYSLHDFCRLSATVCMNENQQVIFRLFVSEQTSVLLAYICRISHKNRWNVYLYV